MLSRVVLASMVVAMTAGGAFTDATAAEADLNKVAKSLKGVATNTSPIYSQTDDHYYRFIGAPKGTAFRTSTPVKSKDPEAAARAYLAEYGAAFGVKSAKVGFATERVRTRGETTYLRFNQTYAGVPVFGAQANVQVAPDGGIESVLSDIMRDTTSLDNGSLSVRATVTGAQAKQKALSFVATLFPGVALAVEGEPVLNLYHPSVIGNFGPTKLVWIVTVNSPDDFEVKQSVFVNAHSGEVVFNYSLVQHKLFRRIYDAYRAFTSDGILRRQEGQGPTGIADVDNAYEFLGDTYQFYFDHHGRDSIDGGGLLLHALVRIDGYRNASWDGSMMRFGADFATDDITAHELTHGVTQWSSNLIYWRESGAMNESFSDIWGEFVDLTNGKGNDSPEVRWVIGEDLPSYMGAIRNMKDPGQFGDPDRYSDWQELPYDNGGVHINSGIGNKLCFLLTDGTTEGSSDIPFNGHSVTGMGIDRVAELFYEAQVNLLTQASSYYDLGLLLTYAAYNLNWTEAEIRNVQEAVRAVEIMPEDSIHPVRMLRATSPEGEARVVLTWQNSHSYADDKVTLVRRTDRFATSSTDLQEGTTPLLTNSTEERFVDTNVTVGQRYYYAVFAQFDRTPQTGDAATEMADYAQVVAGEGEQDYYTQVFSKGGPVPFDLSFRQFIYEPVGDLTEAYESGQPEHYMNYNNYRLTVIDNITNLPVGREGATYLWMTEDGFYFFEPKAPIPLFGKFMTVGAIAANGYIANANDLFDADEWSNTPYYNFPSLQAHFEFPKISFLFSDLSQDSGGYAWMKYLDDRVVVTFEHVPEFGSFRGNTVQVDLYYSGRIRITLLEVNAENVVVGLSDGNGIPIDEATGTAKQTDLSEVSVPSVLSIDPIAPITVNEGEDVTFTVLARVPGGATPTFTAGRVGPTGLLDPLPAGASFAPASGSATDTVNFSWTPAFDQAGYYVFRVIFAQGGLVASQDIQVIVGDIVREPGLLLDQPPTITPAFPTDVDSLRADYVYFQPDGIPEGQSKIYWFRNGVFNGAFTNQREISGEVTQVGEEWHFLVIPTTINGLVGRPYMSNVVTIRAATAPDVNKDGVTDSLDLQAVINAVLGTVLQGPGQDVNSDGKIDSLDVQLVINNILQR